MYTSKDNNLDTSGGAIDVIVVGGGVAGAFAAWRIKTGDVVNTMPGLPVNPSDRSVGLIEASERIGGRLESLAPPGAPELRAEFGGMGFTSHNTILTALVDTVFNLEAEPFPRGGDANLFYLRGERFTKGDLKQGKPIPYRLAANEQPNPMALIIDAVEKVLPGASKFTPKQWRSVQETFIYKGRHLRDIGFWNFLLMNMSSEAFAFAHDVTGHFFEVSNWNCAEALPWFLGDGAAAYRTLTKGYDQLPQTCFGHFVASGGLFSLGDGVAHITENADGTLRVSNADGSVHSDAKRVVLALPQRALQIIAPGSVVLADESTQDLLDTVTGHKVMKIFLAFDHPWWETLGITDGSSSTDLPLGQCWYFGPRAGASNTNSLLMASYNDTLATTYWEGLEGDSTFVNPPTSGQFWEQQAPSELMVAEVMRQLSLLHDVPVPRPYAASYRDWSVDPFGGAFSTWNVGVDAAQVEAALLQPNPHVPLHIVGSTYSSDQGWAEGALATAEALVEEKLGIGKPAWLP